MSNASPKKETKVSDLSFEQALEELDGIVRTLESGEAPLEESISVYERGVSLRKHCEDKLESARKKIEKISIGKDGNPQTSPLDPDSQSSE